jgi:hypothetical protein
MAHLAAASRVTTSIMAPDLWGPWAATATMKVVSPGAAGRTKVVATAAGLAIRKVVPRRLVAAGTIRAMAKAGGTAIREVTRKRRAGVGKGAKVVARLATRSDHVATTRCPLAPGRVMTTTATTAAAMTMSAATAIAGTAAGPAIRKGIQKPRVAAGKTDADETRQQPDQERPSESLAVRCASQGQWRRPRHARGAGVLPSRRGIRNSGGCCKGIWSGRSGSADRDN